MRIIRRGFTLVEVALFLAVSGLLFIGITVGVQNSIWQQRANDSVQDFAEFLKTVYSQVSNPQGAGTFGGRSNMAVYGKLVSFGQQFKLNGDDLSDEQEIFVYDVVGEAESGGTGGTIELLKNLDINVFEIKAGTVNFAGMVESYTPRWRAVIQNTNNIVPELYEGAILIVRNPRSGTVSTFVSPGTVLSINKILGDNAVSIANDILSDSVLDGFVMTQVDFCVNQNGNIIDSNRRNVRLLSGAHNASGVVVVGDDDNVCN